MTWILRACVRCQGDMFPDYEDSQLQYRCLQCGHIKRIDFEILNPNPRNGNYRYKVKNES